VEEDRWKRIGGSGGGGAQPGDVVVVDHKKRTETMTTAGTVREVLTQVGLQLGPHDLVTPPADAAPDTTIKILRLLAPTADVPR
jgi:uncharacterized protein YabE (DUF348 family)